MLDNFLNFFLSNFFFQVFIFAGGFAPAKTFFFLPPPFSLGGAIASPAPPPNDATEGGDYTMVRIVRLESSGETVESY